MTSALLYIFGGLPASGKSTLAKHLAKRTGSLYLRIDSIEEAIRDAGQFVGPEGYEAAYRIAAENLENGLSVVADSVNPIQITRQAWQRVALDQRTAYRQIQVICSNEIEHQHRLEARESGNRSLSWKDVVNREYHPWRDCKVFDTAGETPEESRLRFEKLFC